MTIGDRARDPIGLLIAVSIGLLLGVVLVDRGMPIIVAILCGAGLAVVLFLLMMLAKPSPPPPPPGPDESAGVPDSDEAPSTAEEPDSDGPADRAVEMLRRFANRYADIVAASSTLRDPAHAREVTSLVTVAREVVDLVGQYAAMVATDERRGIEPADRTDVESNSLVPAWDWLTSAADALKHGHYRALDLHVRSLRATRTDLHRHMESGEGTAS